MASDLYVRLPDVRDAELMVRYVGYAWIDATIHTKNTRVL